MMATVFSQFQGRLFKLSKADKALRSASLREAYAAITKPALDPNGRSISSLSLGHGPPSLTRLPDLWTRTTGASDESIDRRRAASLI